MQKRYIVLLGVVLIALIGIAVALTVADYNTTHIQSEKDRYVPNDFIQVARDMEKGIYYNLCDLESDYYGNPDFYPTWKDFKDVPHDYSRWVVSGYGAYPAKIGLGGKPMNIGDSFTTCTYVHAGWGTETYQGLALDMEYDREKFDVSISPNTLLIAPTFPQFIDGWAQRIQVTVTAKQDNIVGTYNFQLVGKPPTPEQNKIYYNSVMDMANFKWYECGSWLRLSSSCDDKTVELRKKTYVASSPLGITTDKFYNVEIIAQ